jgi:hypothetical protein
MGEDAREGIGRDRKFNSVFALEQGIKYLNYGRKNVKISFVTYVFIFCVYGLCHGLGSKSVASNHGGPLLIPSQFVWNLW